MSKPDWKARARAFLDSPVAPERVSVTNLAEFEESLLAAFAATVECETREQCCKDVCEHCANGDTPVYRGVSGWEHLSKNICDLVICKAAAIRQRGEKP